MEKVKQKSKQKSSSWVVSNHTNSKRGRLIARGLSLGALQEGEKHATG
jgi:hypothetical protein